MSSKHFYLLSHLPKPNTESDKPYILYTIQTIMDIYLSHTLLNSAITYKHVMYGHLVSISSWTLQASGWQVLSFLVVVSPRKCLFSKLKAHYSYSVCQLFTVAQQ